VVVFGVCACKVWRVDWTSLGALTFDLPTTLHNGSYGRDSLCNDSRIPMHPFLTHWHFDSSYSIIDDANLTANQ
jgi:hypothetical protein